ncbi:putative RNA-binding protein C25G10.01 [Diplonema papillatum]|nr:putative RNA-binding protein C25G10.01 [Diplonema papillatum]
MRRCVALRAAPTADTTAQWPFGRPEARGTARKFVPYAKTILEGVAAKMADKKQDPPSLISIANHLTHLGIGWKLARNHWNPSGEVTTFVTLTDIFNRRPPYELATAVGYLTVDGETSNCPLYLPQQHYAGWTALEPPAPEEIVEFVDRTGATVDFSAKLRVSGIDYTTTLRDVRRLAAEFGDVKYCDWVPEAYDKATKQALVIYSTVEEAKAAYEKMHDWDLDFMQVTVDPAPRAVPRPPSIGVEVPVDYSFGKMPIEPSYNW